MKIVVAVVWIAAAMLDQSQWCDAVVTKKIDMREMIIPEWDEVAAGITKLAVTTVSKYWHKLEAEDVEHFSVNLQAKSKRSKAKKAIEEYYAAANACFTSNFPVAPVKKTAYASLMVKIRKCVRKDGKMPRFVVSENHSVTAKPSGTPAPMIVEDIVEDATPDAADDGAEDDEPAAEPSVQPPAPTSTPAHVPAPPTAQPTSSPSPTPIHLPTPLPDIPIYAAATESPTSSPTIAPATEAPTTTPTVSPEDGNNESPSTPSTVPEPETNSPALPGISANVPTPAPMGVDVTTEAPATPTESPTLSDTTAPTSPPTPTPQQTLNPQQQSLMRPALNSIPPLSVLDGNQSGSTSMEEWEGYVQNLKVAALNLVAAIKDPVGKARLTEIVTFHYGNLNSCVHKNVAANPDLEFALLVEVIAAHCYVKFRYSLFAGPPPFEFIARKAMTVSPLQVEQWFSKNLAIACADLTGKKAMEASQDAEQHLEKAVRCVYSNLEAAPVSWINRAMYYKIMAQVQQCVGST